MGFKKGNKLRRRTGDDAPLFWEDGEVTDPWEATAYCSGCRDYGPTVPLAKLDHIVNIPAEARMEVGTLLRNSVGCPMSGPSHSKVEVEWKQMRPAAEMAEAA